MEFEKADEKTTAGNDFSANKGIFHNDVLRYSFWGVSVVNYVLSVYLLVRFISFMVQKQPQEIEDGESDGHSNQTKTLPVSTGTSAGQLEAESKEVKSTARNKTKPNQKLNRKGRKNQILHHAMLIILVFKITAATLLQMMFFIGNNSDLICSVLTKLLVFVGGTTVYCCMVFLWLRQHIFYANPLMKKLSPKGLKWISLAAYIEMVGTFVSCAFIHIWWRNYSTANGICRPMVGSIKLSPVFAYGFVASSTITIQITLTYLFVYSLVSYKKQINQRHNKAQKKARSTERLMECIKRALAGTTIAISSDVIGSLIIIWFPQDLPSYSAMVVYEMGVLFNIFCLIYTFPTWRSILFPWSR